MNKMTIAFGCLVVFLATVTAATASPLGISCPTFGTLAVSFGGMGIPNNAVCSTTILNDGNTITLGLTATPEDAGHVVNPAVTNNGAGVFYAQPGGDVLDSEPAWAM